MNEVDKESWECWEDTTSQITDMFLVLLTTQKYRTLSSFYLVFRLFDNTMLIALVVALLLDYSSEDMLEIIKENYIIFR